MQYLNNPPVLDHERVRISAVDRSLSNLNVTSPVTLPYWARAEVGSKVVHIAASCAEAEMMVSIETKSGARFGSWRERIQRLLIELGWVNG
jgi:hypothetical protein